MNMMEKLHSAILKKNADPRNLEITGNMLHIDCRDCGRMPDVGSPACVRCMVSAVSEKGSVDRIRLRSGKDTEISGAAAEVLCEMAFIERSMHSTSESSGMHGCRSCGFSCAEMLDTAWAGFPDPCFDDARAKLMVFRPQNRDCENCMQKTYRALEQAELGFRGVRGKLLQKAGNGGR